MISINHYSALISISETALLGRERYQEVVIARETYWLYMNINGYHPVQIASLFSGRDRTTILSGIKVARGMAEIGDQKIRKYLDALGIFSLQETINTPNIRNIAKNIQYE